MRRLSCRTIPDISKLREVTVVYRTRQVSLRPGERIELVDRIPCRPGETSTILGVAEIVSWMPARLVELLNDPEHGEAEVELCGYRGKTPQEFVDIMCHEHKTDPWAQVMRIEFRHVDPDPGERVDALISKSEERRYSECGVPFSVTRDDPLESVELERWADDGGPVREEVPQ